MAQRNRAAVIGFVVGVGAVVAYFAMVVVHNPRLTPLLRFPALHLALLAVGLTFSFIGVSGAWSRPPRLRGRRLASILAAINVALAAFLCFFLFVATAKLPTAAKAPQPGQPAPQFSLPDQNGKSVSLASLRGRNLVLVFYRGFW